MAKKLTKKAVKALKGKLDMSEAARMARARDMGFDADKVWYHGTPDSRGLWNGGFKSEKDRLGMGASREAHFFSDDFKTANTYADDRRAFDYQNADPEVIRAFIRSESPFVVDAKGARFRYIESDLVRDAIVANVPDGPKRDNMLRAIDVGDGNWTTDQLVDFSNRWGFDGIEVRNVVDDYNGKGKPSTVKVATNPANIRAVDAAFDPSKKDSADLLASISPLLGTTAASTAAIEAVGNALDKKKNVSLLGIPGEKLVQAGEFLAANDNPVETLLGTNNHLTQGASWLVDDYMEGLANWLKQTGKGEEKTLLDRLLFSNPAMIGL